jgi:hypothetical protein
MTSNAAAERLTALAFRLADEHASSIFTSECYPVGDGWFRIPSRLDRDGYLNRALRWLRARELLVRNPKDREQWRPKHR